MPWGLKRFYGSGDLHFITASCYRRQAFLASEQRRDLFLAVLEQVRQRYGFVVVGYVVMPEHIHLLLSEPEKANPSVVMSTGAGAASVITLTGNPAGSGQRLDRVEDEGSYRLRRKAPHLAKTARYGAPNIS